MAPDAHFSSPATPAAFGESAAAAHLDDILADAKLLVSHESPSNDKTRLDDTLQTLIELVTARLGEPDEFTRIPAEPATLGDVVVCRYEGSVEKQVLIAGHYDTVWPVGTLEAWNPPAHDDPRERLSGPGLFDMKVGLAQAIWAVKLLDDASVARPTVTFVFNGDEEIGSPASSPTIRELARAADVGFVLEAPLNGAVKIGRKGIGNVVVTAEGIEAHAGVEPEKGASAITALMEWCLAASKLADPERGTTINVGLIEGGTGANVIPGRAQAVLDIRHWDPAEPALLDAAFDAITWTDNRVKITQERTWNRPPMPTTDGIERLFALLKEQASAMGTDLEGVAVGGGSDANFVAAEGTPVICGLGADGGGAHARHEFIYPDSVPFFTALLANGIAAVGQEWKG
ncbi:M20 family metallopeptidase [Corynebacterium sp. TA-R-1]|uniref:M20 family metallopeptidase n=1 Tax=Corynebacterium stercoris TaxID=2943490 RepID=A0ABT1FYH6_9CORY|nr:M20 family metallopeptidase [Corynebacterium stercoris]MCP1386815.1 M20 family metallopeptidase [Corynebacterium stercoris]